MPILNKKKKRIIGIAAVVVLLLVVAGNMVAYHYKKIIMETLPPAVVKNTDGLYRISVKNVNVNILNRSITLKGVRMWADSARVSQSKRDSTADAMYFDVEIPKLKVSGIMWDKLTGGAGFSCGTFSIIKPKIVIFKTDSALRIYDTAKSPPITQEFAVADFNIINANIKYVLSGHNDSNAIQLDKCNLELDDWSYSEEYLNDPNKFLMADRGEIKIGVISYSPPSSFYNFALSKLRFDSETNKLTGRDFKMKLRTSVADFYRKARMQKEVYDLHFPTIEFDRINRYMLKRSGVLSAETVYLNHSKIDVLLDRRHPPNMISKLGKFPNQVVRNMKLPLQIHQIKINNGSVTYTEVSNKTNRKASIYFNNIGGTINNVTNIASAWQKDSLAVARLKCKLNKYTDVTSTFRFSLSDPSGSFEMNTRIEGLQSHQLNEQIKAFSLLELRSLNMKSLDIQLKGNEKYASSNFTMLYNNLGIRILKDEKNLSGDKKKKGFLTFVANNMILYSGNPMAGSGIRVIHTEVKRDELKSFFNLIWQNILQGVRETTIRNMEVIDWIKKHEQQNKPLFNRDKRRVRKSSN